MSFVGILASPAVHRSCDLWTQHTRKNGFFKVWYLGMSMTLRVREIYLWHRSRRLRIGSLLAAMLYVALHCIHFDYITRIQPKVRLPHWLPCPEHSFKNFIPCCT